jgi:dTDP-4-amino-4,6-dideoxygalactose transaminase
LGRAADVEGIVELARKRDIRVLEDCSQSHGARRDGKLVGTFGDIAAFSTMYRKASTTGASGGIVYTADEQLYHMTLAHADRGKPRWQDGFDDRNPSQFLFPALNLHTDEISCAIGLTSLARLPKVIDARLSFVREVYRLIEKRSRHCRPFEYSHEDSPFVYPVIVDTSRLECDKVAFAEALRSEGIGLNSHYQYLAADWPFMQRYYADDFDCPNARAIRDSSFCLYLNEHYGVTEAEDICAAIEKVETYYGH